MGVERLQSSAQSLISKTERTATCSAAKSACHQPELGFLYDLLMQFSPSGEPRSSRPSVNSAMSNNAPASSSGIGKRHRHLRSRSCSGEMRVVEDRVGDIASGQLRCCVPAAETCGAEESVYITQGCVRRSPRWERAFVASDRNTLRTRSSDRPMLMLGETASSQSLGRPFRRA